MAGVTPVEFCAFVAGVPSARAASVAPTASPETSWMMSDAVAEFVHPPCTVGLVPTCPAGVFSAKSAVRTVEPVPDDAVTDEISTIDVPPHVAVGVVGLLAVAAAAANAAMTVVPDDRFAVVNVVETDVPDEAVAAVLAD